MNIKIVKMITGEEVIGKFTDNGDGTFRVDKPLVFQVLGVDPVSNSLKVQMIPYMISSPDGVIARLHQAALIFDPQAVDIALENQYIQQTTSVIL